MRFAVDLARWLETLFASRENRVLAQGAVWGAGFRVQGLRLGVSGFGVRVVSPRLVRIGSKP